MTLGHRHIPVRTVGAYVPGGRYPMLASSFMTVIVPKVAGVEHVIACAPPQRDGAGIHPAMLYAMATSGADAILALGGVQALAAMAFGIEGLPGADMIVGAGNAYVAEAKRQLFGDVGIDLLAGPTEIAIIADGGADPTMVAADLLGQAEHGPTSPAVLITTSRDLGRGRAVARSTSCWRRGRPATVAGAAWEAHGQVAVVDDLDAAMALSDEIAPEHLEVQVGRGPPRRLPGGACATTARCSSAREATVAYGDKAVGTNHVLPTMRAARYTGGLWVGKFLKTCTYQRLTEEGTRRVAPAVAAISLRRALRGPRADGRPCAWTASDIAIRRERWHAPDFRLDGKHGRRHRRQPRHRRRQCAAPAREAGAEAVVLLARSRDDLRRGGPSRRALPGRRRRSRPATLDVRSTRDRAAFDDARARRRARQRRRREPARSRSPTCGEETFDELFALNVRGAFFATQAAVRR